MRRYSSHDQPAIIKMIDSIYREYGDIIYLQNADSDLLDIETNYLKHGEFWVETAKDNSELIIGSIAVKLDTRSWVNRFHTDAELNSVACLKRFYLLPKYRGLGLAQKMHDRAIDWCQEHGVKKVYLWSDTRFTRAHAFYLKNGYEQKHIRDMNDGAMPYHEYYFTKNL